MLNGNSLKGLKHNIDFCWHRASNYLNRYRANMFGFQSTTLSNEASKRTLALSQVYLDNMRDMTACMHHAFHRLG